MTTDTIEKYYAVLGISESATIMAVKEAYRQKAKILHPDRNKSPDAHEQFILLSEAYACIINIKSGNTLAQVSYDDWIRQNQEEARQRAREYAQMKYDEYKKTDEYKNSKAASVVYEHVYFFSAVILMLSPLWGYLYQRWAGFIVGFIASLVFVHYWAGIFTKKIRLNLSSFFKSSIIVVKTKEFIYSSITIANLIVLFRYTLNTQLTFLSFALILIVLYSLMFLAIRLETPIIKSYSKFALYFCFIPGIFNLFFFSNFIFSSNPSTEVYSFVHQKYKYPLPSIGRSIGSKSRELEKQAFIILPDNKYQEYPWFRVFLNFDEMQHSSEITYTFEDGLWGLRVLKRYEFTN
jgi:hypothetical protein